MDHKKDATSRRDFLKLAGTSAPVAAVALATGATPAAAAPAQHAGSGLRQTEHVKKYLASARF